MIFFISCFIKPQTTALQAPPAPKITAVLSFISTFSFSNGLIKPIASVLYPYNLPSFICTVFTAPINFAISSISSKYCMIFTLCGIVTLNPVKFNAFNPITAFSKSSGAIGIAIYA